MSGAAGSWTPPAATPLGVESRHDLTAPILSGPIAEFVGDPAFPLFAVTCVVLLAAVVWSVVEAVKTARSKRGNW